MTVDIAGVRARGRDAASQTSKYKSVSIRPGENACPAAKKYSNRRSARVGVPDAAFTQLLSEDLRLHLFY